MECWAGLVDSFLAVFLDICPQHFFIRAALCFVIAMLSESAYFWLSEQPLCTALLCRLLVRCGHFLIVIAGTCTDSSSLSSIHNHSLIRSASPAHSTPFSAPSTVRFVVAVAARELSNACSSDRCHPAQPPTLSSMARHFSVNKQSSTAFRSWQTFTPLDWLHFFGRFLFCLFFLHSLMDNLAHIDAAARRLVHTDLVAADVAPFVVFAFIAVAFVASALFFTVCDPLSFYLILAFLVPQAVLEHVVPLLHLKPGSDAFRLHVAGLLQSVAMLGAVLVIFTYTAHIEWLENERKAEIRHALEEWYAKQEGKEGKTATVADIEQKREVKKVK